MTKLLLIIPVILLLTGCGIAKTEVNDKECVGKECQFTSKQRWEKDKVTCYIRSGGGISCLRDNN